MITVDFAPGEVEAEHPHNADVFAYVLDARRKHRWKISASVGELLNSNLVSHHCFLSLF
jgi:hypothetical protein